MRDVTEGSRTWFRFRLRCVMLLCVTLWLLCVMLCGPLGVLWAIAALGAFVWSYLVPIGSVGFVCALPGLLFDSWVLSCVSLFGRSFSFVYCFLLVTGGTYCLQVGLVMVITWLYVVYLCCGYLALAASYLARIGITLHDVAPYGGPVFW